MRKERQDSEPFMKLQCILFEGLSFILRLLPFLPFRHYTCLSFLKRWRMKWRGLFFLPSKGFKWQPSKSASHRLIPISGSIINFPSIHWKFFFIVECKECLDTKPQNTYVSISLLCHMPAIKAFHSVMS